MLGFNYDIESSTNYLVETSLIPKLFGRSGPLLLLKLACLVALLVQTAANFYHYFIHPDRQVDIIHL